MYLLTQQHDEASSDQPSYQLSDAEIDTILDIYKQEYRYVSRAEITGLSMSFEMQNVNYPYTSEQIFDYITAPTATMFVCQMTYVLVGCLVLLDHPLAAPVGGWERFMALRDEALLRIGNLKTEFSAKVENRSPIKASLAVQQTHAFRSIVHCKLAFSIGQGISGTMHGIVLES